jgi:hypothetical protein
MRALVAVIVERRGPVTDIALSSFSPFHFILHPLPSPGSRTVRCAA